ncbi:MAG TPA: hypothetical protein VFT50_06065 [Baekduia sp.]|nr:hypothetical protein [Baekduia sp.]
MAGDSQFGPAPDFGVPPRTSLPQPSVLATLRQAVDAALAEGVAAARVYARVVRPALAAATSAAGPAPAAGHAALARSAAQAAVARLAGAHPTSDEGLGRRGAVLVPPGALGELDARLLLDVLEAGGWRAEAVPLDRDPAAVVAAVEHGRYELAIALAADAPQVLAAQRACALVRRLAVPPLIVAVAFDTGVEPGPVAADASASDPAALPELLRRRLAGGGARWGVRLTREGDGLVVAPVGVLDATTAQRLRDIVDSRRGLYPRILLDLRELLVADAEGLSALAAWDAEQPWCPTVAALADERTLKALDAAGLGGVLPVA